MLKAYIKLNFDGKKALTVVTKLLIFPLLIIILHAFCYTDKYNKPQLFSDTTCKTNYCV